MDENAIRVGADELPVDVLGEEETEPARYNIESDESVLNHAIHGRVIGQGGAMYLNRPLEALVPPDRARVLTVLHRAGPPLSGRTIAALTGSVSQPTVSRLLTSLVRRGLVHRVPGGYVINREHLAYRALDSLLDSASELRRRVKETVATWSDQPVSVVLFGSTARGEAGLSSDVDLLVVRPDGVAADDDGWAQDVAGLAERVHSWTGASCEVLEYDPAELEQLSRSGDPLVAALLRDGITFAGSDLPRVLEALAR